MSIPDHLTQGDTPGCHQPASGIEVKARRRSVAAMSSDTDEGGKLRIPAFVIVLKDEFVAAVHEPVHNTEI